jgi:hypothetical protein
MDGREKDETAHGADPGHGLEQSQGSGVVLRGGLDEVRLQSVAERILGCVVN